MKTFRLPIAYRGRRLKIECHKADGTSEFVEVEYSPKIELPDCVRSLTVTDAPVQGRGPLALTQQVQVEVVR